MANNLISFDALGAKVFSPVWKSSATPSFGMFASSDGGIGWAIGGVQVMEINPAGDMLSIGAILGVHGLKMLGATSGMVQLLPQSVASGVLYLPNGNDTLVARNSVDTLTNKTMDYNSNTFLNFPGGGGGDVINSGTQDMLAYYATSGTTLSGTFNNPAFKIFNVRDNGADPSGSANSTTAFQESFDDAANGTLYIPDGDYKIVMPPGAAPQFALAITSPISIVAAQSARIFVANATNPYGGNESAVVHIDSDDVTIDGGIWDFGAANYTALSTLQPNAPFFDFFKAISSGSGVILNHINIKNARFLNILTGALATWNCSWCYVDNCWFDKSCFGAVVFRTGDVVGGVNNIGSRNCYYSPDPSNQYQMLNFLGDPNGLRPTTYVDITGNTLNAGDHHTQGGYDNLQLYMNVGGALPAYFRQVNCSGNHFIGGQNQFSTVACMNSVFANNTSEAGFPNVAFCEVGNNVHCVYANNTFDGTASLSGAGGIQGFWETGSPQDIDYVGNHIRNVSTNSAYQLTAGRKTVTGGSITIDYGAGFSGSGVSAFQEFSTIADHITVTGVRISMGGPSIGIGLYNTSHVRVTGCTVDIETPTNPAVLISTDNTQGGGPYGDIMIDKSNSIVGGSTRVGVSQGAGSTLSPNVQFEYMDTDGSTVKYSSGWNANVAGTIGGGTATQSTSKATALSSGSPSLNIFQLDITMNNAALNAGASVTFDWPNTLVLAGDTVFVNHQSAGTIGAYVLNAVCTAGHCSITVTNRTAGNLSEAIVLRAYLLRGPQI